MPFTVPNLSPTGRPIPQAVEKPVLGPGQRCLICFEEDPAAFAACASADCYAVGPFRQESEPLTFTAPRRLVSAFELAARMRAKALELEWDDDDLRTQLLARARALETGDHAEVPEEDF